MEDGITDKGNFVLQTIENNAVRRMSRSMDDLQGERWIGFQTDNVTIIKILCSVQIDISATIGTQVPAGVRQVFFSITMDAVGDAQGLGNLPDSTRMVKVTMSKKDSLYRPTVLLYLLQDTTCLCA